MCRTQVINVRAWYRLQEDEQSLQQDTSSSGGRRRHAGSKKVARSARQGQRPPGVLHARFRGRIDLVMDAVASSTG